MSDYGIEEAKTYHDNGELYSHRFYKDGKQHGEFKSYFDNGELHRHCFYKNGKIQGEYKAYYENGVIGIQCFFKDGDYHGEFKRYHNNGELSEHYFFNNDTQEELSEYIDDPDNITDDEFMNLLMIFGNNFVASKTFIGASP